jgi:hypothetical protein
MAKRKPKTVTEAYAATRKLLDDLSNHEALSVAMCLSALFIHVAADDRGHGLRDLRDQFFDYLCARIEGMPHDPAYHDERIDLPPMESAVVH